MVGQRDGRSQGERAGSVARGSCMTERNEANIILTQYISGISRLVKK